MGNTLDYTYDLDGDTLTIGLEKRVLRRTTAAFDADGDSASGAWV
jgi:hypothetical protein